MKIDSNSYKLLTIIQSYATNSKEQQQAANAYNECCKHEHDDNSVTRYMAGMLYDGLAFGNWPWVK